MARVLALATGGALLTGLAQATAAPAARAAAPSGSRAVAVSLDVITPRIPAKGSTITLSGRLTNNGKSAVTDAHIGLRVRSDGPLETRSALKSADSRTGYSYAQDGDEVDGYTTDVADLPAGGKSTFSISVPVSALHFTDAGVYQLGVALEGSTSSDSTEHVVGINRTLLPWYGADDATGTKHTKISYLWPLIDTSHIAPRGDTDSQRSPIFLDDDLATELAPGGRLRTMVDLARNLQVTWIVDPDLLATVEFMTKGYRVAGPGGDVTKTTAGTGTDLAKQWLNDLRLAVAGDQVIALPFGDTDLASMAHQGQKVAGSTGYLKTGTALGLSTVETILGSTPTADVAWPVDGAIDPSIVSVARTGGAKRIIARSDTFHESEGLDYTPNAARPIGKGTTAVVSDATLSTAFSGAMSDPQDADLAVQSYIAQTLMITMEAPERQRSVVVAPQRMPTVAQAQAMAEAIHETSSAAWATPVYFDEAASAHADSRANRSVPSTKAYPAKLRKQESTVQDFTQLNETQKHLNSFVVILTRQDRVTVPFGNAVLRSLSTSWRGNTAGAAAYRDAIGGYLTDLIGSVHIVDKATLTLSGRSGTIPITVKNELGQPVNVVLKLTSGANIRLEIKDADLPITIEGGHTRTLKFQTKAGANGTVGVTAALYTVDNQLYAFTTFDVHINKVTDLVMLVIGAGLLLLVLAGVRIYRQRKKLAAAGGGDDGGNSGDGDGDPDGTDPEQPGDPAADTGQETWEPSPAGEKVDG
ncbi:DUF6049 family protein [Streptomyces sp. NPDC021020]|uniref:DUF6049 family protein n=1 Tax=Streptomyces sp. NPDC021020 TaxID=3365109 RepID=UPI0037A4A131